MLGLALDNSANRVELGRVAESSLRYLGVPPSNATPRIGAVSRTGDPADVTLSAMRPKRPADPPSEPTTMGPPPPNTVRVPDASGLGARDAVRAIGAVGLVPEIEGTGRLVRQNPQPGAPVAKGSAVRLVFEPGS